MITANVLTFGRGRYAWVALLVLVISWALYLSQSNDVPASGGTWQGYVLGTVSAALIVWLMALGIRKRSYSAVGSVQAWTSAHVYLGLALLGTASFHSAGQLGWNVHSAAYWILVFVVVSGIAGTWMYTTLPNWTAANRKGQYRKELFSELAEINKACLDLGAECPPETELAIRSSIVNTSIGGGVLDQLLARDHSTFVGAVDGASGSTLVRNPGQREILRFVADRAPRVRDGKEANNLAELVSVLSRRQELLRRIRLDIQLSGWLRAWLYVHVPLAVTLISALVVHIITVFMYW